MPTLAEFKAHVLRNMMDLEAVIVDVYTAGAKGLSGFAMFDGGAHKGYHTQRMARLPGCRTVYAIEADPHMAGVLSETLAAAAPGGALIVQLAQALQDDPACREIPWRSSSSHVGRSSIVSRNAAHATIWQDRTEVKYREQTTVPATTIDRILAAETGPLPFIKLDLEGADLLALRGAPVALRRFRPVVAFENSVHAPDVHGFSVAEMIEYFAGLDYVPMDFVGTPLTEATWFGLFEAFAAPREKAAWLSATLQDATARRLAG